LNFDRQGNGRSGAKELQSFKAFSKVGFQALYNLYNRANKDSKTRLRFAEVALTKAVVFGALFTFGISILLNRLFGDGDDDKVIEDISNLSPYRIGSSFNLRLPDGSFIHVPLGQELRPFNALGTNMTLWMLGKRTSAEAAIEFTSAVSDLIPYNPINSMLQYNTDQYGAAIIAGTFDMFAPVAELSMNRNYLGSKIYKENQSPETPGFKQVKTNKKGEPYIEDYALNFSKWIDTMAGGDGAVSGINGNYTNPDKIKHLMGGYLGGWFDQVNYSLNVSMKEDGLKPDDFIPTSIFTSSDKIHERNSGLNSKYFDALDDFQSKKDKVNNWSKAINESTPVEVRNDYINKITSVQTDRYNMIDDLTKTVKRYEDYLPKSQNQDNDIKIISQLKQFVIDFSDEEKPVEETQKKLSEYYQKLYLESIKKR